MKLICLNIWAGQVQKPLFEYIKKESQSTDIFCFQEVFHSVENVKQKESRGVNMHMFGELLILLKGYKGYFIETSKRHNILGPIDLNVSFGSAIFVRKKYKISVHTKYQIVGSVEDTVEDGLTNLPRGLQQLTLKVTKRDLNIFNYHGIPYPGNKLDTPERIRQTKKILGILKTTKGLVILCGDFNLYPETKSVKLFEKKYKNLIKEFKITKTRNEVSWSRHKVKQKFADYIFTSQKISISSFEVPYNEISDHLPLVLEFRI